MVVARNVGMLNPRLSVAKRTDVFVFSVYWDQKGPRSSMPVGPGGVNRHLVNLYRKRMLEIHRKWLDGLLSSGALASDLGFSPIRR